MARTWMSLKKHLVPLAFSLIALAFMLIWVRQVQQSAEGALPDFAVFYCAPRLLETGDLYNVQRLHELERAYTGAFSREHGYVRPPFHALLYWPLAQLSYTAARACWTVALVLAFAGFVALWPGKSSGATLMFASFAMPVFTAFFSGQELPLLLLLLALAAVLMQRGRPFAAGVVLSLCAIKVHLFLLLPLLLIGQRRWQALGGLLTGGGVLLAASFAAAGLSWPVQALQSVLEPQFSPRVETMPNLHGMLAGAQHGPFLEVVLSAVVAAAVWIAARRAPFPLALACTLAAGLLLSYHAYFVDFAILLPAGLTVVADSRLALTRLLAALLISPGSYLFLVMGQPFSIAIVLGVLAMVALLTYEALQTRAGSSMRPG